MAVRSLHIKTAAGESSVYHEDLLYAQVMQVRRDGKLYQEAEADAIPKMRRFLPVPWEGRIYFDPEIPFGLTPPPGGGRYDQSIHEVVFVLYKVP